MRLRVAEIGDAEALRAIYAPYVEDTAITFEYTVPTVQEFAGRIAHTLERWPYLVAEQDGIPVGYAYAAPFKARAAYQWAAEMTVYVRRDRRQSGIGGALYRMLENVLALQNIQVLYACVAYSAAGDVGLNGGSAPFHQRMGYQSAGTFHQCGNKFGRWYDMLYLEKHIGARLDHPLPVRPFPEIRALAAVRLGVV